MGEQGNREKQVGMKIDDDLWHEFKLECVKQRRAVKDVVQDLMRKYIEDRQGAERAEGKQSTAKDNET